MYSVPVRSDSHRGIGELKGILRHDDDHLTLQYQLADPFRGEFLTAPVELELAMATLEGARYRAGFLWLAPSIELRVSDFQSIAALPAEEAGRLRLRVSRSDRTQARRMVDSINALCAQQRLARLDDSLARMTAPVNPDPSAQRRSTYTAERLPRSE